MQSNESLAHSLLRVMISRFGTDVTVWYDPKDYWIHISDEGKELPHVYRRREDEGWDKAYYRISYQMIEEVSDRRERNGLSKEGT